MALAAVIAWLGLHASFAYADALKTTTAYWIDKSETAGVAEATAAVSHNEFKPFEGLLSLGYQRSPVWIKLSLPAGEPSADAWVLRLRPPWHDEIILYDPEFPGGEQVTGDLYPHSADSYQSLNLNFMLPQTNESRSVLLRLQSPHSILLSLEVLPPAQAGYKDQRQLALFVAYMAFLSFVLLASCFTWITDREPVIAAFCAQLFLGIAYAASMYGLLRWWLDGLVSNIWLNQINNLLIIAYPSSTVLFYRVFYSDYGLHPLAARLIELAIAMGVFNIGLVFFGQVNTALALNAFVLSMVGLPLLISPWLFFDRNLPPHPDRLPLWVVRLVVTIMIGFAFVGIQRTLGWAMGSGADLNGFLLHAFLLSLLMSAVLRYRAKQRQRALISDSLAQQQRAEKESFARQNLERFLSMFSHEVKTPLSAVSLAVERGISDQTMSGQAQQAIHDIDQLVKRCLQVDQAEAVAFPLRMEQLDIRDIVQRCVNRFSASDRVVIEGDDGVKAMADAWMTETILSNLIENAIKYAMKELPICINITAGEAQPVRVEVCNWVADASHVELDKLFDKFYRGPRAARLSGAGLGLYLSKTLATQQNGGLTATWLQPRQLCLELRLPNAHWIG